MMQDAGVMYMFYGIEVEFKYRIISMGVCYITGGYDLPNLLNVEASPCQSDRQATGSVKVL
jgi:hypothetical protein